VKYLVQVGERLVEVVLHGDVATVDGVPMTAHLGELPGTPVRLVTVGDEVHRVVAQKGAGKGRYVLRLDGWRFDVEALDERTRTIRELQRASAPSGPAPVIAPMPGLIVRITVVAGDIVQAGQGLVVMEAMKMENELRVSTGGTVKAVLVASGQAVEKGAVLVEME
jgi:acetyl/propionyl-CoA carboxylase alpha subunit